MADYTIEWVDGAYVRVPKRRPGHAVELPAGPVRGSNWHVWSRPRGGRPGELHSERVTITR